MNNIISSDFYRVRKGAALRNTAIGLLAFVVFMLVMFLFMQSGTIIEMGISTNNLSPAEAAEMQQNMQDNLVSIGNGAEFGFAILSEAFMFFFFLPITIAVFCTDFTAGTYRNTLSFESNRVKVYASKLLLSICLCLVLVIGLIVACLILGSLAFGVTGMSAAAVGKLLISALLQLPICLATVSICHCLSALTKKSSSTIAIFMAGYFILVLILQLTTSVLTLPEWIMLIEPQSAGNLLASYDTVPMNEVILTAAYYLGVTAVTAVIGVTHYRKTDMP